VLTIDDFAPTGGTGDVQKYHRDADRLLRGVGNNAGRGRMFADGRLRPAKVSRSLNLVTGEDVPRGQSLRARLFVLPVSPGMIKWERVSLRQAEAATGAYAAALAGYLKWLAGSYADVKAAMPERLVELREQASGSSLHKRTPAISVSLYYGVELFTKFAEEIGVFSPSNSDSFRDRCWTALGKAAAAQNPLVAASDPVQRFVELLGAAIASGRAHVAAMNGKKPPQAASWGWRKRSHDFEPCGERVGWVDGSSLYLEPTVAFAVAQSIAQAGTEPLTINATTLHKRLSERSKLVTVDANRERLQVRRTVEGRSKYVLHVRTDLLGSLAVSATAS
jgi:hypothetical protein